MSDFGDSMSGVYGPGVQELPFIAQLMESMPSITATTLWNVGRVQNTMLGGSRSYRVAQRGAFRRNTIGRAEKLGSSMGRYAFNAGRGVQNANKMLPNMALNKIKPGLGDKLFKIKPYKAAEELVPGTGGFMRQGFNETFRPSRFRRFSRAAAIDSSAYPESAKVYSPFQLAKMGNALVSGDMSKIPGVGKYLGKTKATALQGRVAAKLGYNADDAMPAFSSGLLGRISTNAKLVGMSAEKFDKVKGALGSSLDDIAGGPGKMVGTLSTTTDARMAVTASVRSQVGGKIMGYLDVATEYSKAGRGMAGQKAAQMYADKLAGMGNKAASAGAEKALLHAAQGEAGSFMLRAAPRLAAGAKFLPVIGNAMLIRDAFKMVGTGVGALVKTGLEAGQSIIGSIDKPIMGMGYKDNSVAATSRQRGVMAIQNSQLNARSILGNEAAGLHAHFG